MNDFLYLLLGTGALYLLFQVWNGGTLGISGTQTVTFTDVLGNVITSNLPFTFPHADPNQIVKMAQAISVAEGFGVPGAIPTVGNNPGDLTFAFGFQTNGVLNSAGVLSFTSVQDGWSALMNQVGLMLSGESGEYSLSDTLQTVGGKYAGDVISWPANVASQLGVGINTTLKQIAAV